MTIVDAICLIFLPGLVIFLSGVLYGIHLRD